MTTQENNLALSADVTIDCNQPVNYAAKMEPENLESSIECDLNSLTVEDKPNQPWKGISIDNIYNHHGPFEYQEYSPIVQSDSHIVLFKLPIDTQMQIEPCPLHPPNHWHVDWVKMPHSLWTMYPFKEKERMENGYQPRWEVIIEALQKKIMSSAQLEAAIFSYNSKFSNQWNFPETFFKNLLPKMVQLALQLPTLVIGSIPVLKKHKNTTLSMSQLQIASLLANAFFSTFPNYKKYPNVNFYRLFGAYKDDKFQRSLAVSEKLRCLIHYFRRVTSVAPQGTVTFQRRYIPLDDCPEWGKMTHQLPPLHITSKGTIESNAAGLLQVDFANKKVGGGVLNWGCVQEEIRFVICPELIVTRLFTDVLENTEALVITGIEQYSKYEGYGDYFKWNGDFIDETPRDSSGRRKTSVVAMDAYRFTKRKEQYTIQKINRELNKAYVGFSSVESNQDNLPAISTGNWGCGAFRGDPKLKVFIQLMAAAVNKRSLVYFTFGDQALQDSIAEMYSHLIQLEIPIGIYM
ncbi:poly(ADP-ribose) glycohydrolase-like [Aphidius gifuensis]|uniref:poly(ADP-ribose) glycohydrolase-like n=1 Tax=Aphidius gifuensis TaxID=684658 RepID=UPI001CDBFA83|nr:poly(ADP-ribose) glycohydrolase-like [Aphidius gifuensis]